jgi:hypothetical protein
MTPEEIVAAYRGWAFIGCRRLCRRAWTRWRATHVLRSWFPRALWDCSVSLKRTQIQLMQDLDPRDAYARCLRVD